jgi:hypothetical protein
MKHGLRVPNEVKAAMARVPDKPSSSVPASTVLDDTEYVIKVRVGNQNLTLNLDTGSSDLYFSSFRYQED